MAEPNMNESEDPVLDAMNAEGMEQAAQAVLETVNQMPPADAASFNIAFYEELSDLDGKTIQMHPETSEYIVTDVDTGEIKHVTPVEYVDGEVVPQEPSNPDDFITVVENGEPVLEAIENLVSGLDVPQDAAPEEPKADTEDVDAGVPTADAAAVTAVEEQARKDADARLVRETAEADSQQQLFGMDGQELLQMLIAVLTGDFDALNNALAEAKNEVSENNQGEQNQDIAQETPASAPDTEEPEPEEHDGPTALVENDAPKGYVNEGQGPLLTAVNKPAADPEVSPMIALAMQEDGPSNTSILGSIFGINAENEVSSPQVTQETFVPEPLVTDPQSQPMEVAVTQSAANEEEFTQSEPTEMKLGA